MRRGCLLFALLLLASCAAIEPTGRRFVVFFEPSSAELEETATSVVVAAADWARLRPGMDVSVSSYADTYGSAQANADFTRLRAQAVFDVLVRNGIPATRIQRREVGAVAFQIDAQESRRVVVVVGSP